VNGLSSWLGWRGVVGAVKSVELPEIFPMSLLLGDFVRCDVVTIYSKILTDTLERTHGLSDDQVDLMWDNCVKSNSSDGLITLLAKAMAAKNDLFLVYDKAVKVVRVATDAERTQIKSDYQKQAQSSVGVYISFANFVRSDMVKFYSGLEYCTAASLYKSMNVSKATQLKISDLRASTSLTDSTVATDQAQKVARSLASGRDVLLDAKDSIENATPDLTAVKEAIAFIVNKQSFYLGLPDSYFTGEQTSGMGTTGENDTKATERGLKAYFFSIIKPTVDALFGVKVTYKSQDFRQIAGAMDVLKTFDLTSGEYLSAENKLKIVNSIFNLSEDTKGDKPDPKPDPVAVPPVVVPPKNVTQ
jgi:hypothetical protein